ncbi:MAG: PEP-CTERM sorting domain-containing protein [Vicinamibacterales bacterium]
MHRIAIRSWAPATARRRSSFQGGSSSFEAYFTYGFGTLTLNFYDGLTLLGSVPSAFTDNYVSSFDSLLGNVPNELLSFAAANITSVVITTDGVYTLDDLSFTPAATQTPVPEPSSVVLLLTGVAALARRRVRA